MAKWREELMEWARLQRNRCVEHAEKVAEIAFRKKMVEFGDKATILVDGFKDNVKKEVETIGTRLSVTMQNMQGYPEIGTMLHPVPPPKMECDQERAHRHSKEI